MSNTNITATFIKRLKKSNKANTYWDSTIKGFMLKTFPSGTIKFKFWYTSPIQKDSKGSPKRIMLDLGSYKNEQDFNRARSKAIAYRALVESSQCPALSEEKNLGQRQKEYQQDQITIAHMLKRYTESYAQTENRQSTQTDKTIVFNKHVIPHIGEISVNQVDKAIIQRMVSTIRQESPAQANKALRYLKSAFNEAIEWGGKWEGLISKNPCKGIKITKIDARQRYLDTEELHILVDELEARLTNDELQLKKHNKYLGTKQEFTLLYSVASWAAYFILLTGCRPNEAFQAKKEDFNFVNNTWHISIDNMKSKEQTVKPLNKSAIDLIKRISKLTTGNYLFPVDQRKGNKDKPVKRIDIAFKKITDHLGISNIKPHDLRRTFACHLLLNGVDIFSVSKLLGHSDVNLTAKHYAFLNLHSLDKANAVLDTVINDIKSPKTEVA